MLALLDTIRSTRAAPVAVKGAHATLLLLVANNRPRRIIGDADIADIETRQDHLQRMADAFCAYIALIMDDTGERSSPSFDADEFTRGFADLISDAVLGPMAKAQERS